MSSGYRPGRQAHRVLGILAEAPKGRRDLQAMEPSERKRRKIPYLLDTLAAQGLIRQAGGAYRLTQEGCALLGHLNDQSDAQATRVWRRAAA